MVDEIFLRRHHGYGLPIVMQGLWRTTEPVDAAVLESVHDGLRRGALARRVVRPRVPGARLRWDTSTAAHPLRYDRDPVDDVVRWADARSTVAVDPEFGPGWALSAAPVAGGGTVISLVCSHVVADARGLVSAVDAALAGRPPGPAPTRTSDVVDALRTVGTVLIGGAKASLGLAFSARRRRELREFRETTDAGRQSRPHSTTGTCAAIVDVDAGAWDAAAAAEGGTANGLFLALVTAVADAAGVPMPLHISVPVDTRTSDAVDNAMVITEVVVTPTDSLADIRESSREAFAARPMGAPSGFPEETAQVLPDRIAARLTSGAGELDALCSNIGRLPDSLASLGPYRTTGIATRAMHPGLTVDHPARTTTHLSAYLCALDGTYTLSLVGVDPVRFDSGERLRDLTVAHLAKWGLTARSW
ncbi:Condensation domain-containing protein [Prescottella defluvii]